MHSVSGIIDLSYRLRTHVHGKVVVEFSLTNKSQNRKKEKRTISLYVQKFY